MLKVFLQLPRKFSELVAYLFNEDGSLTDAFVRDVAALPVGIVLWRASTVAPAGWLVCDGREVSRTEYAELFSVTGTRFGAGNLTTTFNLPQTKGRFLVGQNVLDPNFDEIGDSGGESTHVLTAAEAKVGTLLVDSAYMNKCEGGNNTDNLHHFSLNGVQIGGHVHDGLDMTNVSVPLTGATNDAHNTLPPFLVGTYIVKF